MTQLFKLKAGAASAITALTLLALPLAQAANMGKDEYRAGKDRITATYKADKAACAAMSGNAKDICIEEAKGKEKVARAEAEFSYTGKSADQNKVWVAKADAAYAVAKEKCDDSSGNAKSVCVKQAKASRTKSLADAKMSKQIGAAKSDAMEDKRDADYKVAAQKCDAMAGDAKTACISAAKTQFGKS